jgi:hypothetical protein
MNWTQLLKVTEPCVMLTEDVPEVLNESRETVPVAVDLSCQLVALFLKQAELCL